MNNSRFIGAVLTLVVFLGCGGSQTEETGKSEKPELARSEESAQMSQEAVAIVHAWQGDFPVDKLNLLPEDQRENNVGFIGDADTFAAVWQAFISSEQGEPTIDFNTQMVLFTRNVRFYNRINIGKVKVKDGVAEALAMETMSARPIEDKVAMAMAVVARTGIAAVKYRGGIIPVP